MRTTSSIATVHALRGKTILVAKGSAAHANVLEHLADAGLKPKDVKLVFLQPADALSAFANGQGRRLGDLGSLHGASQSDSSRYAASGPPKTDTSSAARPSKR